MGPKAVTMFDILQPELHPAAAAPAHPAPPPPAPEPAEIPPKETLKPPEPEPQPEPVVSQPAKASETPVSAAAQTAQMAQQASAPGAQVEAAEPMVGQGRAGEINWRMLAGAKLRAMVEHEKYYPEAARRAGYTGWCLVHIQLAADGTVSGYGVGDRRGNPLLSRGAEAALKKIQGRSIGMRLPEPLDIPLKIEFELN